MAEVVNTLDSDLHRASYTQPQLLAMNMRSPNETGCLTEMFLNAEEGCKQPEWCNGLDQACGIVGVRNGRQVRGIEKGTLEGAMLGNMWSIRYAIFSHTRPIRGGSVRIVMFRG